MPLSLMIDSGAFSVWNAGKTIDHDKYIKYCKSRPNLTTIVALDVIPPKGSKLTSELKDKVAAEGWSNYLKMIRHLPMEKTLPVFHRGDSFKWLEKMLDFGCPYIGLSPRFDGSNRDRRLSFLNESKKYIYNASGEASVKVHGFAVTNQAMMNGFKWHSVDSSTWAQLAAFGKILMPPYENGGWRFDKNPICIYVSARHSRSHSGDTDWHLESMETQSPHRFKVVQRWLNELGLDLGTHSIQERTTPPPLIKGKESWADKSKTKVFVIEKPGIRNDVISRRLANIYYFRKVNECLDIPYLYLAGGSSSNDRSVLHLENQLVSYAEGETSVDRSYNLLGTCLNISQIRENESCE